jgi:hypothetical protein
LGISVGDSRFNYGYSNNSIHKNNYGAV